MKKKHKETHKERVAKVKNFAEHNKMFTFIAVILCIYVAFSLISGKTKDRQTATEQPASSQSEQLDGEEKVDTGVNSGNEEIPKWRFYPIDLVVLLGGGGFCMVKILQEKRRAKEEFE